MDKKELLVRLNRARGQLDGIERMIEENRACLDSVQQIAAVRSALAQIGIAMLQSEATICARDPKKGDFNKIIEQLFKLN
jgi:DNA-binding FrmR family transcriptional regulator